MIDFFFLIISIAAIYYSSRATSLQWMPKALYACWSILAFLIFNETYQWLAIPHILVYFPAFSLVFLHLYNRKFCGCKKARCCTTTIN
jgi:hypothetical protein